MGISRWQAHRTFNRLAGDTPDRYQRRVCLECAAARLRTGDERIIDIALALGFGSHEAFSRAFTRHFGVAPSLYRAGHQTVADPTHAETVAKHFAGRTDVAVPAVHWDLCSERVLVTDYCEGIKISDAAELAANE